MRPTRDRDQTLEAFAQDMRIFLHRASYSESARTLQQLLGRVEEALSSGDFRVVQFYVERRNYDGAISRLEKIINSHPSFSRIDEVKQLCKTLSTAKQPSNSQENVK